MNKVLVIAGPTATGKSALAIELALRFNGEVINGDSQQVYRQLNIGTAKVTEAEKQGIPHHLLDILDYSQPYSVADFQKAARAAIQDIQDRGKLPILCGGSGHYLKAVLYDYDFKPEDRPQAAFDELNNEELYARLLELDPVSAHKTHQNNRKRVLRAVNMALSGNLKSQREAAQSHEPIYDVFMVVLDLDRALLNQRIEQRVQTMVKQGLVEEVTTWFTSIQAQSFQSFLGIGYKEFRAYLAQQASLESAIESIVIHTRQFAKRQLTWFRHQFEAHWVDPLDLQARRAVIETISQWLTQENT